MRSENKLNRCIALSLFEKSLIRSQRIPIRNSSTLTSIAVASKKTTHQKTALAKNCLSEL